jgi:uncharacterized membrane protein
MSDEMGEVLVVNLVVAPLFAVIGLMVSQAKRSIREGPGTRSAQAQEKFRSTNTYLFSGFALFLLVLLTTISISVVRIGRGEATALGAEVWALMVAFILASLAGVVILIKGIGQGGSRLEIRFGIGYAMNWGQGLSVAFTAFFGGLTLTMIVLGFFL